MSIEIISAHVNQIVKNEMEEIGLVHFAQDLGPQIGFAEFERLVEDAHHIFTNKPAKGFGYFKPESDFQSKLDTLLEGNCNFLEFSYYESTHLVQELSKYPFADTGLVMFARYRHLASELMIVAIIPFAEGVNINDQLSVNKVNYLNTPSITIAAMINLTEYQTNPNQLRYVTFLKGRSGRGVSDFFLDFLGLDIGFETKLQNQILMQAVQDFISDQQADQEEALAIRKQVKTHCFDVANLGEELDVVELSGELPLNNGKSFESYVVENGYELAAQFPVDKKMISKLVTFRGAGGGITIQFDRILLSERVFYDAETDTLTIKGTPPNLRDQLVRGL
ncbi:nucleoid-associated protein YejK [Vibrio anguillarum]|uniref:nucleoid-associated protein YejK n=1 Tax=Vibrio anguillarum TaxID=55601 RepID=UPI00097E4037|nr:nucleoid-associated protein YejK [Vibrio anguillarum]QCW19894.1 nucleoid-associated protein [Vibrio phage Va_PF430-3_p42]AQM21458.1 nucleoid-associated protein YejK [Vibrio anguillarum]AUB86174.1 nucleoid-associated protein YejK [Vibrio anguillarum]AUB89612.1 nucleoid-associated protein YejK [Vibrio anguillarum]AUB93054.1 nucleoid-associated protein YejK [Vibrio anguillarum]